MGGGEGSNVCIYSMAMRMHSTATALDSRGVIIHFMHSTVIIYGIRDILFAIAARDVMYLKHHIWFMISTQGTNVSKEVSVTSQSDVIMFTSGVLG